MASVANNRAGEWFGLERLPEMDDALFNGWTEMLEARTGMVLHPARRSFLLTSISIRMREIGFRDPLAYFELLQSNGEGVVEWTTLVDRLTVHETCFYRHPESLQFIREQFLPESLSNHDKPYSLQVWSLGCATGEESYSLAMLIDHHLKSLGGDYYFGVTGTDISLDAIAEAKQATYGPMRLSKLPQSLLEAYFSPVEGGRYRVNESLRRRVCFAKLKIMDIDRAPMGAMDIIYCQNVLIYFERARRFEILNSAARYLAPGGLLILGPGEAPGWKPDGLERINDSNVVAYRRRADAEGSEVKL
ncbi:CheR family methyltransferase [Candidatus Reidiella endopervernicosa]|nr:protein-glutamate O-methyltransferase CheR [Candidatus Reidiella endopervernicosa]QKQ24887.1 protein-glutamate O-methyltransferase CheR [Candidatus Reidiella endopervernicosa]